MSQAVFYRSPDFFTESIDKITNKDFFQISPKV